MCSNAASPSVFRCPTEYPLIFVIDFKIIGHRLSWTSVVGHDLRKLLNFMMEIFFEKWQREKIMTMKIINFVCKSFEKDEYKLYFITKNRKMTNYPSAHSGPNILYRIFFSLFKI